MKQGLEARIKRCIAKGLAPLFLAGAAFGFYNNFFSDFKEREYEKIIQHCKLSDSKAREQRNSELNKKHGLKLERADNLEGKTRTFYTITANGKEIFNKKCSSGQIWSPDEKRFVFFNMPDFDNKYYDVLCYDGLSNNINCLEGELRAFTTPLYWRDNSNLVMELGGFTLAQQIHDIYNLDVITGEMTKLTNFSNFASDIFRNMLLFSLSMGTLAFLSIYLQNKKYKPRKGSLKPGSLIELLSLPVDCTLKYPWISSIIGGYLIAKQAVPISTFPMKNFADCAHYHYGLLASVMYFTTPFLKLFLDQLSHFKKPILATLPKSVGYSILKIKAGMEGDIPRKNKYGAKALNQMEESPDKRLANELLNLDSKLDEACFNLTRVMEYKAKNRNYLNPFSKFAAWLLHQLSRAASKKSLRKNPSGKLEVLLDLQQDCLQLDDKARVLELSDQIIAETRAGSMIPILINQAKVLDYYGRDSQALWRQIALTLLKEYNPKYSFRISGGTKSEVLEIKPTASVSGANTIIIERSDSYEKLARVYAIEKYLSTATNRATPVPLVLLDTRSLLESQAFARQYYLFIERKSGEPIPVWGIKAGSIDKILRLLALYQREATMNIAKIQVPLENLDYNEYFERKFLHRAVPDEGLKSKLRFGIEPVIAHLQNRKRYFNHFNLHNKNILVNGDETTFIDSEEAVLASFGIDLGFLANYLAVEQLVDPYYKLFGRKEGFRLKDFEKEAYSAMTLASAHLVGRNAVYNEGRENEFLLNLKDFAEKLPQFYPGHHAELESFRKSLDEITL